MIVPNIIADKYLRVVLAVSFALHSVITVLMLVKFLSRRESIVLHFDVYRGIDFVGGRVDLIGILFSGFIMIALNFLLADFLYTRDRFFAYVLSFASLLLAILFAILMVIIYSIN
ncbi:MAG: hypothetical protein ACD_81C00087G0006 [uncultured bacterium]|uniref:Uncharacterized protein n=2 Tax=Candidatus Wolfeibacteriota TaxID=1752735 RepID=A0A0G1H8F3_9BACT|nr:MAG: hypothetical protein ACD_81C00087G0006 [uncultured bacterium]KKR12713.1 MAG: hypothetical protein UT41_C0001G0257 [Candidatus Wolfebacteria bacterium GW2011_GWC2_39_22]KKT43646.1 MAG: hypothetical protein UW32_C0001G0238 [Candidatus Wolfebacteria bacterium GW2011_GWE2_44_13]HBI25625.1 hypothetical protein [Candidatus Wolfebacteria bacterium]